MLVLTVDATPRKTGQRQGKGKIYFPLKTQIFCLQIKINGDEGTSSFFLFALEAQRTLRVSKNKRR